MEGARWAAAAQARGIPFVSVRVISDRADNALPLPRHLLLTPDGAVHWRRWLRAAAAQETSWADAYRRLQVARRDWPTACRRLTEVGKQLQAWQRTVR
jgi:hypothetical protein